MMSAVDRIYLEADSIINKLDEISLQISAKDFFTKSLLLASASHFEFTLCTIVLQYVNDCSGQSVILNSFVKNKAIERQYHNWFQWKENNANSFYGLFGEEFKQSILNQINNSKALKDSVTAFLEIGRERNKLVHQDYANFQMEKTFEEVYATYKLALPFIETIRVALTHKPQSN